MVGVLNTCSVFKTIYIMLIDKNIKKYTMANKMTNPYLNDPINTVCYKENESEHSKNSGNYKKYTQKVNK